MNMYDRNRMILLIDIFQEALENAEKDKEESLGIMQMRMLSDLGLSSRKDLLNQYSLIDIKWAYIAEREGMIEVKEDILEALGYEKED